jgi:hypothetical protein
MARRRLVFFASADPAENPGPARNAYHFANVAAQAGLEAEVRLAGDAVKVALPGVIAATPRGDELREKLRLGAEGAFMVSM